MSETILTSNNNSVNPASTSVYIFIAIAESTEIILAPNRDEALCMAARSNDQETINDYKSFVEQAEASPGETIYIDDELALSCQTISIDS